MITVKADNKQRVRLPDAKPGQVFALDNNGDGSVRLTPVKRDAKEAFPRGSLLKYMTPERDAEITAIAKSAIIGVPKERRDKMERGD